MTGIPHEFPLPEDAFERQRSLLGGHVEVRRHVAVRGRRRRTPVLILAAAVVVLGTASAFAIMRDVSPTPFAHGRESRVVEGVRFSFSGPRPTPSKWGLSGWQSGPATKAGVRSLLISKSLGVAGQHAQAVVFWTGFRDRTEATPCAKLLGSVVDGSTAEIAAAVARAPGTRLLAGPTRVTVGGRSAHHVVLRVRRDRGCDPGYFFSWRNPWGGAFWGGTDAGDTIRVWIVKVAGTRLFIEAETENPDVGQNHPAVRAEFTKVEQEIANIVRSIRFE